MIKCILSSFLLFLLLGISISSCQKSSDLVLGGWYPMKISTRWTYLNTFSGNEMEQEIIRYESLNGHDCFVVKSSSAHQEAVREYYYSLKADGLYLIAEKVPATIFDPARLRSQKDLLYIYKSKNLFLKKSGKVGDSWSSYVLRIINDNVESGLQEVEVEKRYVRNELVETSLGTFDCLVLQVSGSEKEEYFSEGNGIVLTIGRSSIDDKIFESRSELIYFDK